MNTVIFGWGLCFNSLTDSPLADVEGGVVLRTHGWNCWSQ